MNANRSLTTMLPGLLLLGMMAAGTRPARASDEDITVDTVEDVVDLAGSQQVGDLPGPDGRIAFREAILAANNTPGPQTIVFAIPMSEWGMSDDLAILELEHGAFIVTGDETTIDFSTQTRFTGDTNPGGGEVGIFGLEPAGAEVPAIVLDADNCSIIGLDRVEQRGFGVSISGDHNRIIDCTISGPLHAAVEVVGRVSGNDLHSYPELTSAVAVNNTITIEGRLKSTPGRRFTIEFHAGTARDPGGFGERHALLGSVRVDIDRSGVAEFSETFSRTVPVGALITATAKEISAGNTSEFSTCRTVEPPPIPGDINGDGVVDIADQLSLLAAWGPCFGCPEDLNGDDEVNIADLLIVFANWG